MEPGNLPDVATPRPQSRSRPRPRPHPTPTAANGPTPDSPAAPLDGPTAPLTPRPRPRPRPTGARSAVRATLRHLGDAMPRSERLKLAKNVHRLRMATLILVCLLLLGALPAVLAIRQATRDPVFAELDALAVPAWAAATHDDLASGSRWCLGHCRYRERTLQSTRLVAETNSAYQNALIKEGWKPWTLADCAEPSVVGEYTCWQRDEYTLDLWVRPAPCDFSQPAPPQANGPDLRCANSLVTVKVRNRIDDPRDS